jgi:inosose dehydratase
VLEFDSPTSTLPYAQVLDEMREAGYAGTELGDWGFMPTDPGLLADELDRRRLQLIAAFVPIALARQDAHIAGVETSVRTARLLRRAAGPDALIVLSDDNARIPLRAQHAGRIRPEHGLSAAGWTTFAAGAERVARAVREETGLRTVFHPHGGGYVEAPWEIDELLARTDPALLGLCLDTGHIAYGGGNPLEILERHATRVWHVHFKDCDPAIAKAAREAGLSYTDAVGRRLFCELGSGSVDFRAIVDALRRHGYDGWIVVEQDVFPGCGTPLASARRNRAYLQALQL